MKIRIVLADDHQIVREGLHALIATERDLVVVAEAEDGRTAVQLVADHEPDVVIMDIGMPELNGVDATRQILAHHPGIKVIALSMHSDSRFVTGMLKAGAAGYLLKNCACDELVNAINTVMQHRIYLSPSITGVVIEDYIRRSAAIEEPVLTQREREVLQLLAEGKATREIAKKLHVSAKTVATHRQNIMDKLDLHSVAQLTQYAISQGLVTLQG